MRFEIISLREVAQSLRQPFQPRAVTEVGEYGCYLLRCEGELPLHRHPLHDELLWPLDHAFSLLGASGSRRVPVGEIVRVPRGWQHGASAPHSAHLLLIGQGSWTGSLNGHHPAQPPESPDFLSPEAVLAGVPPNVPQFLTGCDRLQLYCEQVVGTGPSRRHPSDVLVMPLRGSLGVRCGGRVTVAQELELARLPGRRGWNLFGNALVVWMTPERDE